MTPETRAFLAGVRDAEDPSLDEQRRVFSAINAAIGVGAAGVALSAASGPAKLGRVLGLATAPATKLLALAVWVAATGGDAPLDTAETRTARSRSAAPPAAVIASPSAELPPAPKAASEPAAIPALNSARPPARRPRRAHGAASADLRGELALLAEVQRELQRGDGAAALALLQAPARDAQLLAERNAAEILALCAAGRVPEARRNAAEFTRRHPSSVHASAIARSCAGAGPEPLQPKEK